MFWNLWRQLGRVCYVIMLWSLLLQTSACHTFTHRTVLCHTYVPPLYCHMSTVILQKNKRLERGGDECAVCVWVCMYVCEYAQCVCVHEYACIYVWMNMHTGCVFVCVHMWTSVCVCKCVCTCVNMHTVCVCVNMHVCAWVCECMCTCVSMHIVRAWTCVHVCMLVDVHVCVCESVWKYEVYIFVSKCNKSTKPSKTWPMGWDLTQV